ncbi:MAG: hypothetical protein EOP02_00895, partial [Proteobacteria bacterium]
PRPAASHWASPHGQSPPGPTRRPRPAAARRRSGGKAGGAQPLMPPRWLACTKGANCVKPYLA